MLVWCSDNWQTVWRPVLDTILAWQDLLEFSQFLRAQGHLYAIICYTLVELFLRSVFLNMLMAKFMPIHLTYEWVILREEVRELLKSPREAKWSITEKILLESLTCEIASKVADLTFYLDLSLPKTHQAHKEPELELEVTLGIYSSSQERVRGKWVPWQVIKPESYN